MVLVSIKVFFLKRSAQLPSFQKLEVVKYPLNPFYPNVPFDIEASNLISTENQMTGFYMKGKTGLKWVKLCYKSISAGA